MALYRRGAWTGLIGRGDGVGQFRATGDRGGQELVRGVSESMSELPGHIGPYEITREIGRVPEPYPVRTRCDFAACPAMWTSSPAWDTFALTSTGR